MNYRNLNLLFLVLILSFLFWRNLFAFESDKIKAVSLPTVTATPSLTPTPTIATPARLVIPKLVVNAVIEPVSYDENGTMFLPQEPDKVGWYIHGFKPGETGSAVIGGHLDQTDGSPAVFYRLKDLVPGDEIMTVDELNIERMFVIRSKQEYPYDQVPLANIFENTNGQILNMITCSGVYNGPMQNYSHRLVISAQFVQRTNQ